MREWQGIRRDTDATADGAMYVQNALFQTIGENQRRSGMTKAASVTSGLVMVPYWSIRTGYFVISATSTGTLEATTV